MASNRKIAKRSAPRHTMLWIGMLSLFIVELFFYAWCRVQCVQTGIAIGQANQKIQGLNSLQSNLEIEQARLKAPERISYIARNQLALDLPDQGQVVVVP